jgi:hypothetical protein
MVKCSAGRCRPQGIAHSRCRAVCVGSTYARHIPAGKAQKAYGRYQVLKNHSEAGGGRFDRSAQITMIGGAHGRR